MIADKIEALLADKGYDADAVREELTKAGIEAVIPAKRNRKNPAPHDAEKYKWRNLIERLFSKLKNWRRVATRYDKSKESYLGFVAIAAIKLWLPFVHEALPKTVQFCGIRSVLLRFHAGGHIWIAFFKKLWPSVIGSLCSSPHMRESP